MSGIMDMKSHLYLTEVSYNLDHFYQRFEKYCYSAPRQFIAFIQEKDPMFVS
jgi:chromosome condensin MukBEF MukE localization factor